MNFPKVCYLTGPEDFLVKEKLNEWKRTFTDQYGEMNVKVITSERLVQELETYPFFADKKMLIMEEMADNEETAALLTSVPDFCVVLFTGKLDKRKKTYKTVKKAGEVLELKPYSERQMVDWIIKTGQDKGITIPVQAAKRIVQICGLTDMYYLHNEIIKLSSVKEKVTVDLVNQVVTKSPEYNAFVLTDALTRKDKKKGYSIVQTLAEQNEYLPIILSMVNRNFAVLRMLKTMSEAAVKEAGIHPYTIKLLKAHTGKFTVEELDELMDICQQADFDMKNGADHQITLEKVIGVIK